MSPFVHCVSFPSSSSILNRQGGKITEAEALILCSALQCISACVLCWWQSALGLTNLMKSMIPETEEVQNFPSTFIVKSMDTKALENLQTVLNYLGDMKFTVLNWYSWCNYTDFSHLVVQTCCVFQFYAILRWTWSANKLNIASDHWLYICIWIFENN